MRMPKAIWPQPELSRMSPDTITQVRLRSFVSSLSPLAPEATADVAAVPEAAEVGRPTEKGPEAARVELRREISGMPNRRSFLTTFTLSAQTTIRPMR